jgi:hypothetical protein
MMVDGQQLRTASPSHTQARVGPEHNEHRALLSHVGITSPAADALPNGRYKTRESAQHREQQ